MDATSRTTHSTSPMMAVAMPAVAPRPRSGLVAKPLHSGMWRVTRADGAVLGYVEPVDRGGVVKFVGKRLRPGAARFTELGEAWTPDDAVDLLLAG